MRGLALSVAVLGVFVLIVLLYAEPKTTNSLNETILHERVYISGTVQNERVVGGLRLLTVNDIEVVCNCDGSFKGRAVHIVGVVEEYNGKKQVRALSIEFLPNLNRSN